MLQLLTTPQFGFVSKNSAWFHNSAAYTSLGTPVYVDNGVGGSQKVLCSERVPFKIVVGEILVMLFDSARTLPSVG